MAEIEVLVRFFAELRERLGRREDRLKLPRGGTVEEALAALAARYGESFSGYVFDSRGRFRQGLILLVSGDVVEPEDFTTRRLREGDVLAILPPVGGG
jgi:MoaD family protein